MESVGGWLRLLAECVQASRPGEEPDMMTEDSEDMHLCGDQLRNDDGTFNPFPPLILEPCHLLTPLVRASPRT